MNHKAKSRLTAISGRQLKGLAIIWNELEGERPTI